MSVPRTDLPGWRLVHAEDFDSPCWSFPGGAYAQDWEAYLDGWKDTSGNGTYLPSKVLSAHDGVLDFHLRTQDGLHLVSAPHLRACQTYGRYSVRFRADPLPGYKAAWLLWPESERWPDDGEVDFPEGQLDGAIEAFAHHACPSGGQDGFRSSASFTDWHVATTEWRPGSVTFLLDDEVLGVSTTAVPSTPMRWVLQTETALDGTVPDPSVAGHVLVDWVAYWAYAPGQAG